MKTYFSLLTFCVALSVQADDSTNSTASRAQAKQMTETIVCIRHGEKPRGGLGQLTIRGLNRSLALPRFFWANNPSIFLLPTPRKKWTANLDIFTSGHSPR